MQHEHSSDMFFKISQGWYTSDIPLSLKATIIKLSTDSLAHYSKTAWVLIFTNFYIDANCIFLFWKHILHLNVLGTILITSYVWTLAHVKTLCYSLMIITLLLPLKNYFTVSHKLFYLTFLILTKKSRRIWHHFPIWT